MEAESQSRLDPPRPGPGRLRVAATGGVGAAVVVAIVAANLSARDDGTAEVPESRWEDPHVANAVVAEAALDRARARLTGEPVATGPLGADQHGDLWLCAYNPPSEPLCAPGTGEDSGAAIDAAAARLRELGVDPATSRLKVDWITGRLPASWPEDANPHAAGTFGIGVGEAVILPSEVLERDLFTTEDEDDPPEWDHSAVRALLARRGAEVGESFDFELLRTTSWVEAPNGRVVRTYRVHAWELPKLGAEELEARARIAADALAGAVAPNGRIVYLWDVSAGREKRGSNLLRHAGSTFALLQAAERFDEPRYREAAQRAIDFLLSRTKVDERTGPFGGGQARHVVESSHVKLGGAGLALLALATWQGTTGDGAYADEARELATFLLAQQKESGEFVYFAPKEPGGEPRDETSAYYPGEAVFALATWYALDPDPRWLDTARRGADWLIDVRDAGKGPEKLAADHWLSYGLNELYRHTKDPRYVEHALRIAEAIEHQRTRQAGHEAFHRDYVGGFYEPPRSTPASTRAEALVGILDLCRAAGRDCPEVPDLLRSTLRHAVQAQYTPDLLWWMPERDRVIGGVGGGVVDPDLRNDFTQHALSALLGAERLMVVDSDGGRQ